MISDSVVHEVAHQFGITQLQSVESFSEGLIHHTYKITGKDGRCIILQSVNTYVFKQPEVIVSNYNKLYNHLQVKNFSIPTPINAGNGRWWTTDTHSNFWRAQQFIANSYAETGSVTADKAYEAAKCFGGYIRALSDLAPSEIKETIEHFHDLSFRYDQLIDAVKSTTVQRAQAATEWIEFVDSKKYLINFFLTIQSDVRFKNRLMHHDCKLTNILFDKTTHRAICPVDLDTTMPGYFFSDLGDMIRSMVPSQPENSLAWSELVVQPTIYSSIVKGYTEGVKDAFSEEEQHHLHSSGLLMLFMQGVRFLTDYLLADRYYKTRYENQNLDRAKNQFIIFQQLEKFVFDSFGYQIK